MCAPLSDEPTDKTRSDLVWKHYQLYVELFKHFLELVLKFNVFYYAVTGAVLSFYFSRSESVQRSLLPALWFIVLMSLFFSLLFAFSATRVKYMAKEALRCQQVLMRAMSPEEHSFHPTPEMRVLTYAAGITGMLLLGIAILIMALFLRSQLFEFVHRIL